MSVEILQAPRGGRTLSEAYGGALTCADLDASDCNGHINRVSFEESMEHADKCRWQCVWLDYLGPFACS